MQFIHAEERICKGGCIMSCLQNEIILENLYEEVSAEFPDLTRMEKTIKVYQLFEDLLQ